MPPRRASGNRNAFKPRNIRSEAGDSDASLDALDQFREGGAHFCLTSRMAFNQRIGRITDHREHAFFAKPCEGAFIRGRANQWIGIKLPIARV